MIKVTAEIPVRMLHVVGCAGHELTKYALDAVMIEPRGNAIAAVATDGRRMMVAEYDRGMFDGDVAVLIPGDIARTAVKLASAGRDAEPMAKIEVSDKEGFLTIDTSTGCAKFDWFKLDMQFPDYGSVIPDWRRYSGVGMIGLGAGLVADTLKALQKIAGNDVGVRFYIPKADNRPVGLEIVDDGLKVLGVVMPVAIPDWIEPAVKPTEDTPTLPGVTPTEN